MGRRTPRAGSRARCWSCGLLLPALAALIPAAAGAEESRTVTAGAFGLDLPSFANSQVQERLDDLARFLAGARKLDAAEPQTLSLGGRTIEFPPPAGGDPAVPPDVGSIIHDPEPPPTGPTSDWTPYEGVFGMREAAHLLHRTVIGPRFDEVEASASIGLGSTVAHLLESTPLPPPPGPWATEPRPDTRGWTPEQRDSLNMVYRERRNLLRLWWCDVMIDVDAHPRARESMTLFLHDHFATGAQTVFMPQSMYVQNDLLRRHAFGNFRALVKEIYKDPAMLIWLDGNENYVGHLNENFARELLELFTLGLDQYTQEDIVEAARAFTGWVTMDGLTGLFIPARHDYGLKTFLGQTGAWDGDDIVDIIFQQDEAARFICRKLYRYFLDEYPDDALIEDLAATFRQSGYELEPVLEQMLLSERFFDPEFRGAVYADGIDRSIGVLRSLYLEDLNLMGNYRHPRGTWALLSMADLGQALLEPPNVAGWPGYRTWINATTLPWRKTYDVSLVDGNLFGAPIQMQLDAIALALELTNPNDPLQIVDDLALSLFGMPPTQLVRQRLIDELLQGEEPYDWSIDDPEAESRLQGLVRLAMRLPDYQLK